MTLTETHSPPPISRNCIACRRVLPRRKSGWIPRNFPPGDRSALVELIRAARILDDLFMDQLWSGNHALLDKLKQDHSPNWAARGCNISGSTRPWSDLDGHIAFLPGRAAERSPPARILSRGHVEGAVRSLGQDTARRQAEGSRGLLHVIRREQGKLTDGPLQRGIQRAPGASAPRCSAKQRHTPPTRS